MRIMKADRRAEPKGEGGRGATIRHQGDCMDTQPITPTASPQDTAQTLTQAIWDSFN